MNGQHSHRSGRQPVIARNVVATSQPLASQAGAAAFARGGNAIDAALAAAITLSVVEPTMNGIGGDAFALVWDGSRLHGTDPRTRRWCARDLFCRAGNDRRDARAWRWRAREAR